MSTKATLRSIVVVTSMLALGFVVHRFLRSVHYQRCESDIFQVIFFKNSHMCTFLRTAIDMIENEYAVIFGAVYKTILQHVTR